MIHIVVFLTVVTTVSFNQTSYSIEESKGFLQPVLVLSSPSSVDITVEVREYSGSATRK